MPEAQTPDLNRLPSDIRTLLLDYLPEHYPQPKVRPDQMLTESGRLNFAQDYAKYDLCRILKDKLEKQLKEG